MVFYLENLPIHVDNKMLRYLITRRWRLPPFQKLIDVFIPNKRNNKGRRYGFIEMVGIQNFIDMELALDNQYVGASAIRCCRGKHREARIGQTRPQKEMPVRTTVQQAPKNPKKHPAPSTSQPLSLTPNTTGDLKPVRKEIELVTPEANKAWLKRSLVGVMKKIEQVPKIHDIVADLGWICETRILGRGLVWMEFDTMQEYTKAQNDAQIGVHKLFTKVVPWSNDLEDKGRCVWVQCTGIPVHTWGVDTFHRIGAAIGKLVVIDDCTLIRKRMDVARLLVATNHSRVDMEVVGRLQGKEFIIRYMEEPMQGFVSNLDWCIGARLYEENEEEGGGEEEGEKDEKEGEETEVEDTYMENREKKRLKMSHFVKTL